MLPPCHFGEPASDMGMLRLDLACLLQGVEDFGKPSLRQARVPMRKGPERQRLAGHGPWQDGRGIRMPAAPTYPDDATYAQNDHCQYAYGAPVVPVLYACTLVWRVRARPRR